MHLALLPATIDDIPALTELHFKAFLPTCAITRLVYPHGATRIVLENEVQIRQDHFNEPHVYYMKVVDADNIEHHPAKRLASGPANSSKPEIVAFGRWYIWNEEQSEDKWNFPYENNETGILKDMQMDVDTEYRFGLKEQKRRFIKGQRHAYLSLLATSPAYQQQGCGTMLLNWGLELAAREGLDCWLQAASSAHQFYRNRGFKDISFFDMEVGKVQDGEIAGDLAPCARVLMRKDHDDVELK